MKTILFTKTHKITGLKYFGKTTKTGDAFDKYNGSGVHWVNHLKKNGYLVETDIIGVFETSDPLLEQTALKFSKENDIVNSKEWANLIPENGLDGGATRNGKKHSTKSRKKMSQSHSGKILAQRTKDNIKSGMSNMSETAKLERKRKMVEAHKNEDEIKKSLRYSKLSETLSGKVRTPETRSKMSNSRKGKILMNDGLEQKMIDKNEQNFFQKLGWVKGKIC